MFFLWGWVSFRSLWTGFYLLIHNITIMMVAISIEKKALDMCQKSFKICVCSVAEPHHFNATLVPERKSIWLRIISFLTQSSKLIHILMAPAYTVPARK
jgi:hypothetical protein